MGEKTGNRPERKGTAAETREARLKAALKANMARRKAQARARQAPAETPQDDEPHGGKGQ